MRPHSSVLVSRRWDLLRHYSQSGRREQPQGAYVFNNVQDSWFTLSNLAVFYFLWLSDFITKVLILHGTFNVSQI